MDIKRYRQVTDSELSDKITTYKPINLVFNYVEMSHILTVSGRPGTNHKQISTVIADELKSVYISSDVVFDSLAEQSSMKRLEFERMAEKNPQDIYTVVTSCILHIINKYRYAETISISNTETYTHQNPCDKLPQEINSQLIHKTANWLYSPQQSLIIDSMIAGWIAGRDAQIRLWCHSPRGVRMARLTDTHRQFVTDSDATTVEQVEQADEDMTELCENIYEVDIDNTSIYDMCINTSRWSASNITQTVLNLLENHSKKDDNGATPTPGVFTTEPQFTRPNQCSED